MDKLKSCLTFLILTYSTVGISQSRRFEFHIKAGSILNVPYGDKCNGYDEVEGFRINDIDFSVLGMCTKTSASGGIGFRASMRAWRSVGVMSGVDVNMKSSLMKREFNDPLLANRSRSNFYRVELPTYVGSFNEKWCAFVGYKMVFAEATQHIRESERLGRYIPHKSDLSTVRIRPQPSVGGSYRIKDWYKKALHVFVEIDHRDQIYSWSIRDWVDLQAGCYLIL